MIREKDGCASHRLVMPAVADEGRLAVGYVFIIQFGSHILKGGVRRKHHIRGFVQGKDRFRISENIVFRHKKAVALDAVGGVVFRCVNRLEIAESVVEQFNGIRKLHGGLVLHHHADQLQTVFLGTGDQVLPGFGSISRLAAHQVFISVFLPGQKLVFGVGDQLLGEGGTLRDHIAGGAGHFAQQLIGEKLLGNEGQVMGRSIVIVVVNAVGGHKMGIRAAQFKGRLIHQLHKAFNAPADVLADGVAALVAGTYQQAVKGLFHGDGFPHFDADVGILPPVDAVDRLGGVFHHFIQGTFLPGDPGGEDLGGAGGIEFFVDIFGIEDRAGVGFHEDGRFGADCRSLGPAVDLIAFDGHEFVGFRTGLVINDFRADGENGAAQEGESQGGCYKKGNLFPEKF